MSTVYIVQGTTGEYSDRTDWLVKAFRSQTKADELCHRAQLRAGEIKNSRESRYGAPKNSNEFDPDMRMDYTGTEYTVITVELDEEVFAGEIPEYGDFRGPEALRDEE